MSEIKDAMKNPLVISLINDDSVIQKIEYFKSKFTEVWDLFYPSVADSVSNQIEDLTYLDDCVKT